MNEFLPDWVSAPGETIQEILEQHAWTTEQLAGWLSYAPEHADNLLLGRVRIDEELARLLTRVLGAGTVQFWLNRDSQYVDDCKRLGRTPGEP